MLATKVEEMAREQGYEYLWLGCWKENTKGQVAYTRWGFEKVGEHDFVIGKEVQTDDIFLKKL